MLGALLAGTVVLPPAGALAAPGGAAGGTAGGTAGAGSRDAGEQRVRGVANRGALRPRRRNSNGPQVLLRGRREECCKPRAVPCNIQMLMAAGADTAYTGERSSGGDVRYGRKYAADREGCDEGGKCDENCLVRYFNRLGCDKGCDEECDSNCGQVCNPGPCPSPGACPATWLRRQSAGKRVRGALSALPPPPPPPPHHSLFDLAHSRSDHARRQQFGLRSRTPCTRGRSSLGWFATIICSSHARAIFPY